MSGRVGGLASVMLLASFTVRAEDCRERWSGFIRAGWPEAVVEAGRWRVGAAEPRWIDLDRSQCKVWPSDPRLTLLALKLDGQAEDGPDAYADLEVLVVRTDDARVVARQHSAGLLSSDAIYVVDIGLDTARYRLQAGTTAFGLRIRRAGSSRVNPYQVTSLRLYVLEGDQLHTVVQNLAMDVSGGEWDGQCAGEFHQAHRVLALADSQRAGWADLAITGRLEQDTATVNDDGGCTTQGAAPRREQHLLHYDGRGYPVPAELRGLDADYGG